MEMLSDPVLDEASLTSSRLLDCAGMTRIYND